MEKIGLNSKNYITYKGEELTLGQVRIALLQTFYKEIPLYNMSFKAIIEGKLDIKLLTKCINIILNRHPILRTNIVIENDKFVWKKNKKDFEIIVSENNDIKSLKKKLIDVPFKIGKELLMKIIFLKNKNELLISFSDLIIDGFTIVNLLKELATLYSNLKKKQLPKLPKVLQYKCNITKNSLHFWRRILPKSLFLKFKINTDKPSMKSNKIYFKIADSEYKCLKTKIKELKTTLFDYFTSVFLIFLHILTLQKSIVIDTIFGNYESNIIGLYNDVVLLPINFTNKIKSMKFHEFIKFYSKILFEIKTNRIPLETLCKNNTFDNLPFIRIHFEYSNSNTSNYLEFEDTKMTFPVEETSSTTRQLLTFNVCESDDNSITCNINYKENCFSNNFIVKITEKLKNLLLFCNDNNLNDIIENNKINCDYDYIYNKKFDERLLAYSMAGHYPDMKYSDFENKMKNFL